MKLKTLSKIDWACSACITIMLSPIWLSILFLTIPKRLLSFIYEWVTSLYIQFSNRLLKYADEVKDGTIANEHYLRCCTPKQLYNVWVTHHHRHKVT